MSIFYNPATGTYMNTNTVISNNFGSVSAFPAANTNIWNTSASVNTNNSSSSSKKSDSDLMMEFMTMLVPLMLKDKKERSSETSTEHKLQLKNQKLENELVKTKYELEGAKSKNKTDDADTTTEDTADASDKTDNTEDVETLSVEKKDKNGMDGAKAGAVITNRFDYLDSLIHKDGIISRNELEMVSDAGEKELASAAKWWLNHSGELTLMENGDDKKVKNDDAFSKKEVADYAAAKEGEKALDGKEMNAVTAAQILKVNMEILNCGDGLVGSAELTAAMGKTSDPMLKSALQWFANNPEAFAEMDNTYSDGRIGNPGDRCYGDELIGLDNINGFITNYATA